MPNETGFIKDTIIAPLPRRSHSTPFNYNNHQQKLNKLIQPQYNSKPIKLNQDPDEVLNEFLSLFDPSEPIQSIPILISHPSDTLSGTPNKSPSSPHSPHTTTTIHPPTQPSSPPLDSQNQTIDANQNYQLGPNNFPNHLSSIVSSPISRCHNPLPRHAGLDVLACRVTEPFTSHPIDPHPNHLHNADKEDEEEEEPKTPMAEEHQDTHNHESVPVAFLNLDNANTPNSDLS